ncbi:MAG: hypothetical protein FE78DRAFT_71928 [Acidomyces sp. 'richmondensis']|nr:MAG: hypothetical protein FE78DRAFT_71928 [Acidomyces sp. 'richmondensis']
MYDGAVHTTPEPRPANNEAATMTTTITTIKDITQAQRQAIMDNLQLEITDRARKLRAQYSLQAQSLRMRLEMRVNRIPLALRKRTMGELLEEGARRRDEENAAPVVIAEVERGVKRNSDVMFNNERPGDNKENSLLAAPIATKPSSHSNNNEGSLPNPKKRTRTHGPPAAATANTKATRTASRKAPTTTAVVGGGVLSPKSHNSRTLPRSPLKSMPSSEKSTRPVSPVKPAVAAVTRRLQSQQRGAVECEGRSSGGSESSSAGTTIVRKASSAVVKKGVGKKVGAVTAGGKTVSAGKKAGTTVPPPGGGGRTLRKRG